MQGSHRGATHRRNNKQKTDLRGACPSVRSLVSDSFSGHCGQTVGFYRDPQGVGETVYLPNPTVDPCDLGCYTNNMKYFYTQFFKFSRIELNSVSISSLLWCKKKQIIMRGSTLFFYSKKIAKPTNHQCKRNKPVM